MRFIQDRIAFDPEFPLQIFSCSGCSRDDIFLHTHDCLELNLVAQGTGVYLIGEKRYPIAAGDLVILNHWEHHIAVNEKDLLLKVLVFDPGMVWQNNNAMDYKYLQTFYEWKKGFPPCFSPDHPLTETLASVFHQIEEEVEKKQEGYRLLVKALLLQILSLLYRVFAQSENTSEQVLKFQRDYNRIEASLFYLDHHFREPIPLSLLANLSHLTPSYYSRLFHTVTGMTLPAYISHKRLTHACLLLRTSEKNISEIAFQSGFNDVSHFNRLFKLSFGLSPKQYRQTTLLPHADAPTQTADAPDAPHRECSPPAGSW